MKRQEIKLGGKAVAVFFLLAGTLAFFPAGIGGSWSLGAAPALALENPLTIELPKRINASIKNILEVQRKSDAQIKEKEDQIKNLVDRIKLSTDEEEIYRLQKEYLALRAENLKLVALKTVRIEQELGSIHGNLRKLAEIQKSGEKWGLGKGISRDEESRQAIGSMFEGFSSVVAMIETLDPEANLGNTRLSLNTLDELARQYFQGGNAGNAEEQIAFIQEAMVVAKSVQRFLGVESDYLLRQLYYVDAQNLVRKFGQLKDAIFAGLDVSGFFEGIHGQDAEVFKAGGGTPYASASGQGIDTKRWGQY